MLIAFKLFTKYLNSHLGFQYILILLKQKLGVLKWTSGHLGVPVATNVASKAILLDTTALIAFSEASFLPWQIFNFNFGAQGIGPSKAQSHEI